MTRISLRPWTLFGALTLATLTLGACTPMQLTHPQFGAARSTEDQVDCNRAARIEAFNRQPFWGGPPRFYRGRDGRLHQDPWAFSHNDRFFEEAQLQDFCMRNKGYQLVPVG